MQFLQADGSEDPIGSAIHIALRLKWRDAGHDLIVDPSELEITDHQAVWVVPVDRMRALPADDYVLEISRGVGEDHHVVARLLLPVLEGVNP